MSELTYKLKTFMLMQSKSFNNLNALESRLFNELINDVIEEAEEREAILDDCLYRIPNGELATLADDITSYVDELHNVREELEEYKRKCEKQE